MSAQDDRDISVDPTSGDAQPGDTEAVSGASSPTAGLADLTAAAIKSRNFLADGTITALNEASSLIAAPGNQLVPKLDWPMPKLDLPAVDLPMPNLDVPTVDFAARFGPERVDFTRLMGADALASRRDVAGGYLRGIDGAVDAFARASHMLDGITNRPALIGGDAVTRAIGGYQPGIGAARNILGGHSASWARDLFGLTRATESPIYLGDRAREIATGAAGLTNWLDAAVPRVDMSAWSNVVGTASAFNARMNDVFGAATRTMLEIDRSYRALDNLIAPALRNVSSTLVGLAPVMESAAGMWSSQISELMHGWSVLWGFGHRLAGDALRLALKTREALVSDTDRDAVREAVIEFMSRVLGYRRHPSEARIEAVTSALLDDEWFAPVGSSSAEDYSPHDQIRAIARYQHGLWVPLLETKRRGYLIASLEKPDHVASPHSDGDERGRPMDRLRAPEFSPERQPVSHPVLRRVMGSLSEIEQEIVWTRHHDGARSWADAAVMCGRPVAEGETVRRKLLKLKNAELRRRSA